MSKPHSPHIELFVRSLSPDGAHEPQSAVIERLEELDDRDVIEDFSVIVWGKQIARETPAARTEEGRYILNRVAEFKQWALSNNVCLESFYQTTDVESSVTGEAYTAIILPVMGLAEYQDGELVHVAPCSDGDVVHDILERLDALEDGEPPAFAADARLDAVV